jgi:PKHD-type hydroxylase
MSPLSAHLPTLVEREIVRLASQKLEANMKKPGDGKVSKSPALSVTPRSPREILEPIPIHARPLPQFVAARGLFTLSQCETLLEKTRFYRSDSESFGRRVDISYLKPEQFGWVFAKIASVASRKNLWGLALSAISEPMRIQRYRRRDYSDPHSDYDYATPDHSKLTVIVPLVDRRDWEGGVLEIGNSFLAPRMQQGDAVIFPSFSLHRVTPVTSGVRIVLSAWISGPPLR